MLVTNHYHHQKNPTGKMENNTMSNATSLLHCIPVDSLTAEISVPICQTGSFIQEAPGINNGYDYARSNNPTLGNSEKKCGGG